MVDPDAVPALHPDAPAPPAGSPVVDWITDGTRRDRGVLSTVPPGFARYAILGIPHDDAAKTRADTALVALLQSHGPDGPWWLGYLDTGVADVIDPDAPRVSACFGWPYVLLMGSPEQALGARSNSDSTPWHSALPELLFPTDRSWLVSTPWDDEWRCVGGPEALVDALVRHPDLEVSAVTPDGRS